MRIRQLDLLRYGHFTDASIALPASTPDIHGVLGENEAGKSTAMAGIEDLLFGIPSNSPRNFLHEYGARRHLNRRYVLAFFQKLSPCVVGIEACGSSHYWSREIKALGHTVRPMRPRALHQRQVDQGDCAVRLMRAVAQTVWTSARPRPVRAFQGPIATDNSCEPCSRHRYRAWIVREGRFPLLLADNRKVELEVCGESRSNACSERRCKAS
jgi:hypothetical protein